MSRLMQKGQTSVEYIMLVLAVVLIMWSVFGKLKVFFAAEATNCTAESKELICQIKKAFSVGGSLPFRYYTLRH